MKARDYYALVERARLQREDATLPRTKEEWQQRRDRNALLRARVYAVGLALLFLAVYALGLFWGAEP